MTRDCNHSLGRVSYDAKKFSFVTICSQRAFNYKTMTNETAQKALNWACEQKFDQ